MRTTILAYVMAIVGLALIVADIYVLSNEQTFVVTLTDYGVSIRTIAGGFIMIGRRGVRRRLGCCRLDIGHATRPAEIVGPSVRHRDSFTRAQPNGRPRTLAAPERLCAGRGSSSSTSFRKYASPRSCASPRCSGRCPSNLA
jgi:hypothetical protein